MENVQIRTYETPVQDDICQGVLALVADNVTSLSMMHPPSNHPRFEAYRTALHIVIRTINTLLHAYMRWGLMRLESAHCC